jgi:hypothetical protein
MGTRVLGIFQVQIFASISILLSALLDSICWAIHYKYHSWSIGITRFSCPRTFVHHCKNILTWIHYIIGLQHFQKFCRVSMLPVEVPWPLQQPKILYKPLASFVALCILFSHIQHYCRFMQPFYGLKNIHETSGSLGDLISALSQLTHNCMVAIRAK